MPDDVARTVAPRIAEHAAAGRLRGRRLRLARVTWLALATALVALDALLLPTYAAQLHTVCAGPRCGLVQPSPGGAAALRHLGLALGTYATVTFGATIVSSLLCFAVGTVIFVRKSDDTMALVAALSEIALGSVLVPFVLATGHSSVHLLATALNAFIYVVLFLHFSLFPSGRFVPRWTAWLVVAWAAAAIVFVAADAVTGALWFTAYNVAWVGAMACVVAAQLYRYRAVSDPVQRQQTRWVVFGGSAAIAAVVALDLPRLLVPAVARPGSPYEMLSLPVDALPVLLFSLSVGIAVLRHRLFEIDLIIRRTLVYGVVTGSLAGAYLACVLLLQAIFRALTGQGSTLAIVASTLAIAALFQPWLVRVRAVVDRRFYRARYDAARTLATFGAALQSETDLTRLSWRLAEVVEEALRPEHVSLWLIGRPHRHGDGPTHVEVVRVEPAASSSPAADSVGETHAAAPSPAPRPGFAP